MLEDREMLSIRSAEYHTVLAEGVVAMAPHADYGSLVTIDLMLSDTDAFEGGRFQTLESDGQTCVEPRRPNLVLPNTPPPPLLITARLRLNSHQTMPLTARRLSLVPTDFPTRVLRLPGLPGRALASAPLRSPLPTDFPTRLSAATRSFSSRTNTTASQASRPGGARSSWPRSGRGCQEGARSGAIIRGCRATATTSRLRCTSGTRGGRIRESG